MAQETLTFETICKVDHGSIALAFNKLLAAAYSDLLDRPGLETARKIGLSVTLKPHESKHGTDLKYVSVDFEVIGKNPGQSLSLPMRVDLVGLLFQTEHSGNPDQESFDFPDEGKDDKEA